MSEYLDRIRYPSKFSQKLKLQVKTRDNFSCQVCGKIEEPDKPALHVHHIDHNRSNNTLENLLTLCSHCHPQYKSSVAPATICITTRQGYENERKIDLIPALLQLLAIARSSR